MKFVSLSKNTLDGITGFMIIGLVFGVFMFAISAPIEAKYRQLNRSAMIVPGEVTRISSEWFSRYKSSDSYRVTHIDYKYRVQNQQCLGRFDLNARDERHYTAGTPLRVYVDSSNPYNSRPEGYTDNPKTLLYRLSLLLTLLPISFFVLRGAVAFVNAKSNGVGLKS